MPARLVPVGCAWKTRSSHGDDFAECIASRDRGFIAVYAADGATSVETHGSGRLPSRVVAVRVVRDATEVLELHLDAAKDARIGELEFTKGAEILRELATTFNSTTEQPFYDPYVRRNILSRLRSILSILPGRAGASKQSAASTLALGVAHDRLGFIGFVAGDSRLYLAFCRRLAVERQGGVLRLEPLTGIWLQEVAPPLDSSTMIRLDIAPRRRGRISGYEAKYSSTPYTVAASSTMFDALKASGYETLVVIAATDGVNLSRPIVDTKTVQQKDGGTLLVAAPNQALIDTLRRVDENLVNPVEGSLKLWPLWSWGLTIAHIVAYTACLESQTGNRLVEELIDDLLDDNMPWVNRGDDRSIAVAYANLEEKPDREPGETQSTNPAQRH